MLLNCPFKSAIELGFKSIYAMETRISLIISLIDCIPNRKKEPDMKCDTLAMRSTQTKCVSSSNASLQYVTQICCVFVDLCFTIFTNYNENKHSLGFMRIAF